MLNVMHLNISIIQYCCMYILNLSCKVSSAITLPLLSQTSQISSALQSLFPRLQSVKYREPQVLLGLNQPSTSYVL